MKAQVERENLEKAIGSVVLGILAGVVAFVVSALLLIMYGLASGRIKLFEYPAQSQSWTPWDIWALAISLAVGVMTTIFVSRSLFKWRESGRGGIPFQ